MVSLLSHGRYRPWLAGCAVAVVDFIVSYWAVLQQRESLGIIEQTRFTHEAKAFTDALGQRVAANTEIVFGLHSLFSLNPSLGRADFDRVVTELDAARRYPGVRNLAFTKRVAREDKAAYEESVRNDPSLAPAHRALFAIRPAGERDEYFVVHYIWPMRSDAEMLGLDISAQPANLASMHFSRDSGRPVASAPFDLIQERDHRTGFVIRIPVFGPPQPGNAAQRPFLGAVAVTLRVYDMVRALQSQGYLQGLSVAIEDAGSVRVPAQEGTSRSLLEHTAEVLAGARPLTRELEVHSRLWRLTFLPTQSLLSPSEQRLPWVAGAAGGIVSVLLGLLTAMLVRQRTIALVQAKASDNARRQSEERFSALFNQAAVGVAQVDSHTGIIQRINQRYCDIIGYSPEELEGRSLREISHPDDQPAGFAQMERLKAGDIAEFRIEKRYFHKNGREVWVDLTVTPMWSQGSNPDYHIAMVQDITARKQMEETLRGNEQRLLNILQRLPVGLCLVQRDGRMSFRNERFVEICGYTEEDISTAEQWWLKAYPDVELRTRHRAAWSSALTQAHKSGGAIQAAEYSIQCRDGQQRTVEIAGVLVGDDHLLTMVDLSQRKAAEEEIRYLAFYDPLTRLPNRRLLMDRLQQALATSARHQRSGALLLLDLDNFKTLNETQGHDRGDTLLLQVSHRLRACVHEDDTVARQGGDEFVVVLEDLGDTREEAAARAEEAAQKILLALREPYTLDGETHHSSLSMGITIFSGMRETVDELLKRADLAMYQAKSAGRDTLRFYDPQMQAAVSEQAALIDWQTPPQQICDYSNPPFAKWFVGGTTNLCHNAVDRHLKTRADQPALVAISTETDTERSYSFAELHAEVQRMAATLQGLGVKKGDRVLIYMPMIAEAAFAMLACVRIGALHSVVFGGFASGSLASRIEDAEPVAVVSADAGSRGGKVVPYKPLLDEAIALSAHKPAAVLMVNRGLAPMDWQAGRDHDWASLREQHLNASVPCEWVESTHPSYTLYTSGTTGKPKGVQRDTGGYTVALAASMKHIFDAQAGQTYFATSDIGWVVGHSYIIYGPLIAGMTTIMYEGLPTRPDAGVWWSIVEKYKVTHMFSAPAAVRVLKKQDPSWLKKYDVSSLKALWLAGEPLDEPTAQWISDALAVPIIDNYWQTETGWPILTLANGVEQQTTRFGSPGKAMYGYAVKIVDESTGEELTGPNQKGVVGIEGPLPPGCMQTVWRDDARFVNTYWKSIPGRLLYSTFDWGIRDADGYHFILGRTDDVINVAGHRLGTREIEESIASHPNIAEVAVVGVADQLKGQVAMAFAVAKDASGLDSDAARLKLEGEVMKQVDHQLGAVARPSRVYFVNVLPKTRSGKLLRRALQAVAERRDPGDLTTMDDPAALQQVKDLVG